MLHQSVLISEVLEALDLKNRNLIVDATLGLGGHSLEIFRNSDFSGIILGIDQDPQHLKFAENRLEEYSERFIPICENFSEIAEILNEKNLFCDGIFFDLGVASPHFDNYKRGFSLHNDGPLDMRMNPDQIQTAAAIINHESKHDLSFIFRCYGEEPLARLIASKICDVRKTKPFERTSELRDLVESVYHSRHKYPNRHPATKVFQALRIAVNKELDVLKHAIDTSIKILKPGGRIVVISYHSLEDRIVKKAFKHAENPCICPPKQPFCTCGLTPQLSILTRKPITPSDIEVDANPRSRSAKLRIVEKLKENCEFQT